MTLHTAIIPGIVAGLFMGTGAEGCGSPASP